MDIITRRSFLGSLALGSIYPTVEQAAGSQLQAAERRAHTSDTHWSIAKQSSVAKLNRIDFWSKPLGGIRYADELPSEIRRGALFYGETGQPLARPVLTPANSSDPVILHRGTGVSTLAELLVTEVSVIAKSSRIKPTALIALDSRWSGRTGPDWADILPVFRKCYDRLIGHYHINQRGFHHWKNSMIEGAPDAPCFERFFTSAALQCDAVVFTSQSLIENDVHLSARDSTEILAGELLQRFAQVLLDDEVAREIAPMRTTNCAPKYPRCYALGSAGASKTYPTVGLADLLRQRELTFSSFGKPVLRPLIIGLGLDERSAECIRTQISRTDKYDIPKRITDTGEL